MVACTRTSVSMVINETKMASGDKVLLSAKRTTYVDAEGISNLVRKSVTALFGNVDIIEVM